MPSARPTHYRLTPQAISDLESIWTYTAETWSVEQAEAYIDELTHIFELIVATPEMAREYHEFSLPVRIHSHRSHVIIYMMKGDHVVIVRVLGGRQDWRAILSAIDG